MKTKGFDFITQGGEVLSLTDKNALCMILFDENATHPNSLRHLILRLYHYDGSGSSVGAVNDY